jgi:NAD(P) transhydrogenase subunit alpha
LKLFIPKEADAAETRVPALPETVKRLSDLGIDIAIEKGLGAGLHLDDKQYQEAGAEVVTEVASGYGEADMVLRLGKPAEEDVAQLRDGAIHISHLDPFFEASLVRTLAKQNISAICMEMIPRTTLAQKMDALSSQANIAGYAAVILAADRLSQIMPMMMTPAGTINPARVFIIGAGVAGLQAIATAKRLGARVEAFDTRPVVEEQVQSLGAKFVKIDIGETGQTKDGYAKKLTDEQLEKQRQGMAEHCAQADVVITTAKLFGRKAPLIVTKDMVEGMRPGSIIVDLAVETGGNVEGSKPGEEVDVNGVRIIGLRNLPGLYPVDASQMYASNTANLIDHFWDKEEKAFNLDLEDEILNACVITHGGEIVNESIRKHLEQGA